MKKLVLICIAVCFMAFAFGQELQKTTPPNPFVKVKFEKGVVYPIGELGLIDGTQLMYEQNPEWIKYINKIDEEIIKRGPVDNSSKATRIIPTVIHLIYGTVGDKVYNISNTHCQTVIAQMNQLFNGQISGAVNPGVANIQFCLATKDPSGNSTNGITRTQSSYANGGTLNDLATVIEWNTNNTAEYLNIYVQVTCYGGAAGWSGIGSVSSGGGSVAIYEKAFNAPATYFTVEHEVGHYLGLYHTNMYQMYGTGCTSSCDGNTATNCATCGDKVCDIPPDGSSGCTSATNSCTETPTDLPDDIYNIQHSAPNGGCRKRISQGQADRINACLNGTSASFLYSSTNLIATGCNIVGIEDNELAKTTLYQNKPNPLTNTTEFSFYLAKTSKVELFITDLHGRKVATVVNENKARGEHKIIFDASKLSKGIYFYTMRTDNYVSSKKMIIVN